MNKIKPNHSYKHKWLLNFHDTRNKVSYYYRPRQILEALDYAATEVSYSNHTTGLLRVAGMCVKDYFKREGIPLGPSTESLQKKDEQKRSREHAREMVQLKKVQLLIANEEFTKAEKILDKLNKKKV